MNKHERHLAKKKVAARRARKVGWTEKFDKLPAETQQAFRHTGNIRLSRVSDRKSFSRSPSARDCYGRSHLSHRFQHERAVLRTAWEEAEVEPTRNKYQRELRRFIKRPKAPLAFF